ncbi:MAG: putative sugar nucleotidyl transferase, partial [Planctomycetota bacterium]
MKIIVFEPPEFPLLYPLTYFRPVFELRCGALTLRQKVQEKFPDCELHLETRDALVEVSTATYGSGAVNSEERLRFDDDVLLVSGTAILSGPAADYSARETVATTEEGAFIWAYLRQDSLEGLAVESARDLAWEAARRLAPRVGDDILIRYPWDLIWHNAAQIRADFRDAFGPATEGAVDERAAVYGPAENLFVGQGAEVEPWTFIDCREGPVIIGPGAVVHAYSSIEGPAFIGAEAELFRACIREGTSVGPVCRVGGEVEESIIHGYSNKYHTGFLGHSYVGEWVNLGALTVNSDLRNDYATVPVHIDGRSVDSGLMKVGAFIGDHTKTSIGTALNTG